MLSLRAFIVLVIVASASVPALADGKVFRRGVAELPPIPDQQAIIVWDEGTKTETLAIETRFAAATPTKPGVSGADSEAPYAWVVPLPGPGAPQITAATTGLFPTVREVFQPRAIDSTAPQWLACSLPVVVVLLLGVWLIKIHKSSALMSVLVLSIGLVFVLTLLLPSLGSARGSGARPVPDVRVLERSIVGSYEIAVIGAGGAADSGAALASWLNTEGFGVPISAQPILRDYAARKWVFAAVKLHPDPASNGQTHLTPHPLVFRFASDGPIYPMRLTGHGNGPLALDLYVFGAERAIAPGLTEIRCDRCEFGKECKEADTRWHRTGGTVAVVHPGLAEIVGTRSVATKLSGTLSPKDQAADMRIAWAPYNEIGRVKYSPRYAIHDAIDKGTLLFAGLVLVLVIVGSLARKEGAWIFRRLGWAAAPAAVLGVGVWAMTPTVPIVAEGRTRLWERDRKVSDLADALAGRVMLGTSVTMPRIPTVESVRQAAGELVKELHVDIREEDSPGNYRIAESTDGIELLIYNDFGAPAPHPIWAGNRKDR